MPNDPTTAQEPGSEAVHQAGRLLDVFAASRGLARVEAEKALLEAGENEARAIHQEVLQRVRKWNRLKIKSDGRSLCYMLGTVPAVLFTLLLKTFLGGEAVQTAGFSVAGGLVAAMLADAFVSSARIRTARESFVAALDVLARVPEAALTPLLLQLYSIDRYFPIRAQMHPGDLQQALLEGLKKVRQSDAALFSTLQRHQLIAVLENSTQTLSFQSPELTVAALRVLQVIGDRTAMPMVKRVSQQGITPSICSAARACYAALAAESRAPQNTLLRGSAAPDVQADTLLRAACGSGTTQPQELLRAAGEEDGALSDAQPARAEYSVRKANGEAGKEEGKQIQAGLAQERAHDR